MVNRREASIAPQGVVPPLHSHVLAPHLLHVALGLILVCVWHSCACTFQQHAQFLRRALPDLAKLKLIEVTPCNARFSGIAPDRHQRSWARPSQAYIKVLAECAWMSSTRTLAVDVESEAREGDARGLFTMTTVNENLDLMKDAKKARRKNLRSVEKDKLAGYAKKIRKKMGRGLEAEFDAIALINKARVIFDVLEDSIGQFNQWVASELTYGSPVVGSAIQMMRRVFRRNDLVLEEQEAKDKSLIEYLRVTECGAFVKFKGCADELELPVLITAEFKACRKLHIENLDGIDNAHDLDATAASDDLGVLGEVKCTDAVEVEVGEYDLVANSSAGHEVVNAVPVGREAEEPSESFNIDRIRQAYLLQEEVKRHSLKNRRLLKKLHAELTAGEELLSKSKVQRQEIQSLLAVIANQRQEIQAILEKLSKSKALLAERLETVRGRDDSVTQFEQQDAEGDAS